MTASASVCTTMCDQCGETTTESVPSIGLQATWIRIECGGGVVAGSGHMRDVYDACSVICAQKILADLVGGTPSAREGR